MLGELEDMGYLVTCKNVMVRVLMPLATRNNELGEQ
jgi:hypothetical protein